MAEARPTRHQRAISQDFANQLAQMAAGWRIVNDSKLLMGEPIEGVIEINAIDGSASINGNRVELAMASELQGWASEELTRKDLGSSWLTRASIELRYKRSHRIGREPSVELKASARVSSAYGEASGSFTNSQPLLEP
jgi:hypothetical protein